MQFVLPLIALTAFGKLYALTHVMDKEGFLGRYANYVKFGQLSISTPDALTRKSEPCSSASVAVIHEKFTIFILDLRVIG